MKSLEGQSTEHTTVKSPYHFFYFHQKLRAEIEKFKDTLETLEETGKDIIAASNEDPKVVRDVRGELAKIAVPMEVLAKKLADRQAKLQNALIRSQEFQVSFDDFMNNLGELEDRLAAQEPISALLETAKSQRQENEQLAQTLKEQEPLYEKLLENGQAVAETLEDEPERNVLEQKLDEMKKRWEDAKEKVASRQDQLEKVEPQARIYRDEADSFEAVLSDAEKKVEEFEPLCIDKASIAKQKELLQEVKEAAEKLKSDLPDLEKDSKDLREAAERHQPVVEAEVEDLIARYEKLNAALDDRELGLATLEDAADQYHVKVQQVEDVFAQAYDVVDAPESFGTDTDKAQEKLAKIQVGDKWRYFT